MRWVLVTCCFACRAGPSARYVKGFGCNFFLRKVNCFSVKFFGGGGRGMSLCMKSEDRVCIISGLSSKKRVGDDISLYMFRKLWRFALIIVRVFRIVTPGSIIGLYRRFGWTCYLLLQRRSELGQSPSHITSDGRSVCYVVESLLGPMARFFSLLDAYPLGLACPLSKDFVRYIHYHICSFKYMPCAK
jgi:hypothetical protein